MENKKGRKDTAENKHFDYVNRRILFNLPGDTMVWKQEVFDLQEAGTWEKSSFGVDLPW